MRIGNKSGGGGIKSRVKSFPLEFDGGGGLKSFQAVANFFGWGVCKNFLGSNL